MRKIVTLPPKDIIEPFPKEEMPSGVSRGSLDDILERQMLGLERLTKLLVTDISTGKITKDTPQALSTVIKITMELKAKEKELLEDLTDEELEKIINNAPDKRSSSKGTGKT